MKKEHKGSTLFTDFQKNINAASDSARRSVLVDTLMKELEKPGAYPIFESDTTAVLVHRTAEDSVFINGDMTFWSTLKPFSRVEGTDVFFYRDTLPSDARLEYWLTYAPDSLGMPDPLNRFRVGSGFGPMSELSMPEYEPHPVFDRFRSGTPGDTNLVSQFLMDSEILDYEHNILIYLPDHYESHPEKRFPVIYFQDGIDYIEFAFTPYVLDWLIDQGEIEPLIAVFVSPPNRFSPDMPNRMTEYGLNDDYVAFFCDELVPLIDQRYRTQADPASRLVVGDSFGGLISVYIPFLRPDVFGLGYSQSGYLSFRDDRLIRYVAEEDRKPIRLYVEVGTFERNVGAGLLPPEETDFLLANRNFRQVLEEKGYDFVYREYNEGHTWGNWRRHLIEGVMYFFKK